MKHLPGASAWAIDDWETVRLQTGKFMADAGIGSCRLFGSTVLALTAPRKMPRAADRDIALVGEASDLIGVAARLSERGYTLSPTVRRFEMNRREFCLIVAASAPDGVIWDICMLSNVESIGLFDLESAQLELPTGRLHGAERALGALRRRRLRLRIPFLAAHPALVAQRLLRLASKHRLSPGGLCALRIPCNRHSPPAARASLLATVLDILLTAGPAQRSLRSDASRRILSAVDPRLSRAVTNALQRYACQVRAAHSRMQILAVLANALDPPQRRPFARDCLALLRLRNRSGSVIPMLRSAGGLHAAARPARAGRPSRPEQAQSSSRARDRRLIFIDDRHSLV